MRLIDAYENEQWAKEHIFDAKERNAIIDFLRDCSTVDAVPVVHGEWRHIVVMPYTQREAGKGRSRSIVRNAAQK